MNGRRTWLAAPAAALLLVGISATPAMASTTLEIGQRASLVARGVAVDVPVTYTCSPPTSPELDFYYTAFSVRVTQVVRGQQVAAGRAELGWPVCDDTPRTVTARVTVEPGAAPFKAGIALIDAHLSTYDWSVGEVTADVSEEVRIGR